MNFGLTYSILLHIFLFLILLFGVDYSRRLQPQEETILLELIPISTITNVKTTLNDVKPLDAKKEVVAKNDAKRDTKTVLKDSEFDSQNMSQKPLEPKKPEIEKKEEKEIKLEPKKEVEKKEEKKEEVKQEKPKKEEKSEDDKKEKIPSREVKKEPEVKKKDQVKKPEKKEIKKEKKEEQSKKKEKSKKDTKKSSNGDLANSVLKSLQEGGKKSSKNNKTQQSLNDIMENAIKGDTTSEFDKESDLSMSEIDVIRSQISKAWRVTSFSGGKENKNLRVTIAIDVEENGEVRDIKVKSKIIPTGVDPKIYNAFLDSVVRAVRVASPLQNLPKEKYSNWSEMELVFDSSGMIY